MTMCMKCGRRQSGEYKGDPSACACGRGPENPPKLWAFYGLALDGDEVDSDPLLYAYESEATAREAQEVDKSHDEEGIVGAVQAYVREDVAAAEMAAQVEINAALHDYSDEITVRICQMAEDLGLKSESLEVGPDAAEVLSAIHDVLGERDALRRERDALAAATSDVARVFWRREAEVRLSALRAYLCDIGERGETDLRERAFVASIERSLREDDAAAKGVG